MRRWSRTRPSRRPKHSASTPFTAAHASNRADHVNKRVDTIVENIDAYTLLKTVAVNFAVSRDTLDDAAIGSLNALAADLQGKKGYVLDIQGYTDATGSDKRNIALSDRRARAVYQYLAEHGIPLFRMNLLGFGEGQPVADNGTVEGRAENRRVEVRLMTTKIED